MKSILQKEKECYLCKILLEIDTISGLHEHHIFEGTGRRKQSEKFGLKVYLCAKHHNMSEYGVHFNKNLDLMLKRIAQEKFEETHTREDFIEHFIKSYL